MTNDKPTASLLSELLAAGSLDRIRADWKAEGDFVLRALTDHENRTGVRASAEEVDGFFAAYRAGAVAPAPRFVDLEEVGLAPAKGVLDLNQGNPVPTFVDLVTVYPEAPARYRRNS